MITGLPQTVNWKEITKEQRGELIYSAIVGLREAVKTIDSSWLQIGMIWHFIVKNKAYRHYGDHIKNANDFIREIDIGVKRSMLDHYARMWGMFSKYLNGKDVPIRKLLLVAPVVAEDTVEEWVEKAEAMPYDALKNEVREKQGKIATDVCDHPPEFNELWVRCKKCEKFLQKLPKGISR